MILVPSIFPSTGPEAARALGALAGSGTPAELRLDGLENPRPRVLLGLPRPPLIVTCRRRAEGGRFRGSAREATGLLLEAVRNGAEYVDAEYSLGAANLRRLFEAAGRRRIVLSYHNPSRTPADLTARFRAMASHRPAFVKIAVTARSFADTGRVVGLLAGARGTRQAVSAIAMGEYGVYTRILQGALGGALTFAAHDPSNPSAPGQVPASEMDGLYRVRGIDRRTRIFGLLGNPVKFSRGIVYHNSVFARRRRNAVYVNFAADDAGDFLRIVGPRITGLSVTMPFKGAIREHLDRVEGSSALTGSVNTVLRKRGKLLGSNTDFHAFLSLAGKRRRLSGSTMLVMGTGNTAATAAAAGVVSGARVVVSGRNPRRARQLAGRFGCDWVPVSEQRTARAEIVVNATPVGMDPSAPGDRGAGLVSAEVLRSCRLLCDFANPPSGETPLVARARRRGCAVITGAEIFRRQAALQSRLFLELA